MAKKRQRPRKPPVKFPSAYRYMGLGLILPIFVSAGMIIGYNYGATLGEYYAGILAVVGCTTGLLLATVIILKVTLLWDKRILLALKKSRQKRSSK